MCFDLMPLKIHLRFEDDKLPLQTLLVWAEKVVLPEMDFKFIVIAIVDRLGSLGSAIADMTTLVLFPAMSEQLVITIESLPAKSAFWMTFEASLIHSTGIVISELLMLSKLGVRE